VIPWGYAIFIAAVAFVWGWVISIWLMTAPEEERKKGESWRT